VSGPATQPIADWLAKIGLERYAPAFVDNDIDVSVLFHLTDADLEKIGVSLGHRRKMLAAIAELIGAVQAPPQPALTEPKTQDTAERRQVTVMFSDLVGSTALSARMDPEDLREIISSYQKCVAETVQRFDGFVAKYLGDGVLVYFGYPEAHEDDAERAVRAGLDVIAAVSGLKTRAAAKHLTQDGALPMQRRAEDCVTVQSIGSILSEIRESTNVAREASFDEAKAQHQCSTGAERRRIVIVPGKRSVCRNWQACSGYADAEYRNEPRNHSL
jgi:SAM domain (Sterile alpha motif)/Adenylate and Guanylate cyclase catalytic domain